MISFSIHGSFYLLLARLPTRMKSGGGKGVGGEGGGRLHDRVRERQRRA